jgi:ChrR Cupin-like domain
MKIKLLLSTLAGMGLLCSQTGPAAAITANLAEAKWTHDAGDPPGSESVLLREDPKTGAMELLARYPAGHVFAPHWHSVNERIVLLEGRISLKQTDGERFLDVGGFAFLPAREVQKLACVSKTRCTFYVYWDGKLDFHAAAR